jgi:hypothetical protein
VLYRAMPFFFSVIEDLLGIKGEAMAASDHS